jgi:hypothetical protein
MTTDLVRIFRVSSGETNVPGLRQWVIDATLVAQPSQSLQLETVNDYAASLCQRAKDLNKPIAVTHVHTKYGRTLKSAHFLKVEPAA